MITIDDILATGGGCDFASAALAVFRHQAVHCAPYAEYLSLIGIDPAAVDAPERIPHLPIELFKSRDVYCGPQPPQIIFTSSTTGGGVPSRHMMARVEDYERTFSAIFERFYGSPADVAIFALLPGYLERQGSSLVYMADRLIAAGCGQGGFFLNDYERLIREMERCRKPKILLGVSYALWDLAERHAPKLENTVVMETGGMKGHREELPKEQFHKILQDAFDVEAIHSEYGMAELTSQAYSAGGNRFAAPPWMRVTVRDLNDPFDVRARGQGAINITDLANLSSCAFVQTADLGAVHADGTFSVSGRADRSEVRGCNLLVQ